MEEQKTIRIIDGPCKEKLFRDFEFFNKTAITQFQVKNDNDEVIILPVRIKGVVAKNGTGNLWDLSLLFNKDSLNKKGESAWSLVRILGGLGKTVKACYSTEKEKGEIFID